MTYRIAAIPVTLTDLQGHSATAFSNVIFRRASTATDKITTDITHHAVPLR